MLQCPQVLFRNPKALLKSSEQLAKDAGQVRRSALPLIFACVFCM